jgi:hypothetical protein
MAKRDYSLLTSDKLLRQEKCDGGLRIMRNVETAITGSSAGRDAERRQRAFPRGAWEREANDPPDAALDRRAGGDDPAIPLH